MLNRFSRLRSLMNVQNVDAALISAPANLFYLTGYRGFSPLERDGYLVVTKNTVYLITNALLFNDIQKQVPDLPLCLLSADHTIHDWLALLAKKHRIATLGFESTNISVSEYKHISPVFKKKISLDLSTLRLYKDETEIAAIQAACVLGDKVFSYIRETIQPGMTEKEVATLLELFIRKEQAFLSFPTIVATDTNAAAPHHMTDETKITKNSLVLFDMGVLFNGYCSDMSRTIFMGKPTAEQKKMYFAVRDAQQKAAEYIQTKLTKGKQIKTSEPDKIARNHIISEGFPEYPHSLGHGIGIEVHEPRRLSPYSEGYLEDRMVFSIEPGIYLPDVGGVRIEDLYTIQGEKLIQLTKSSSQL